jgi:hypothetical protein
MGGKTNYDWLQMRADYEDGVSDLSELAESAGLKLDTVKKRAGAEGWKRPDTDKTVRRLKNHRVQMLEAICNSTMQGLLKADDLLTECDCLRDVETHSKTVKNYKDICIGKSPDDFLNEAQPDNGMAGIIAELDVLSDADTAAILNEAE